jgi:hypothetical protein
LTDDDLTAAGLVSIRAFVRTKASKNAARCAKARAKAAEAGIHQVNVRAAGENAEAYIRSVAEASREGRPWPAPPKGVAVDGAPDIAAERQAAYDAGFAAAQAAAPTPPDPRALRIGAKVLALTGWRRWLADVALGEEI